MNLVIDRATAARFGITPATVDNALYDLFGQRIISTIYTQSNQYRVIMEADPSLQQSLASLNSIRLPSSAAANGQVPLSAIVHVEQKPGPLAIGHLGQFPATTISFDTAPGASLGAAVADVRQAEKDIGLPGSFLTAFQGAASALESSLSNELLLVLAAIATVYIVLGVLYESFIHPITILSTLPSAGAGALIALLIAGDDIDVISIIGIILLIGIVKKNAIMMIDFALVAEREEGKSPLEAIHQAALLRFRPDHDDHNGGIARSVAVDAGQRHRIGTAPPAWRRDRRWPYRKSGADNFHHTGDLPDVRSARRAHCRS